MEKFTNITIRKYSYMFDFEKKFRHEEKIDWMVQNWTNAFYYIILYIFVIFGIQRYMQDKPRITLQTTLTLWNLGLTTFSIIALLRTGPEFFHMISNYGFYYSVCTQSFVTLDRVSGYWTWMCALSKVVELGDTVFIVLRKQPLIFLHWYHHIATLLAVWYALGNGVILSTGRWYMVMNLFIHSIMYFYYAVRAMGYTPPRKLPMLITTVQILQMAIGVGINIYAFNLIRNGVPCYVTMDSMKMTGMIYFSYLILFANFFYRSYFLGKKISKMGIKSSQSSNSKVE